MAGDGVKGKGRTIPSRASGSVWCLDCVLKATESLRRFVSGAEVRSGLPLTKTVWGQH